MNTETTTTAAILESVDHLDPFAQPAMTQVPATRVRECMVLLDPELGTPAYWIDHRIPSTPRSGQAEFMVHNLETGRFERLAITGHVEVPVMAR